MGSRTNAARLVRSAAFAAMLGAAGTAAAYTTARRAASGDGPSAGVAAPTEDGVPAPAPGAQTWNRTNHRGEPVTLLEGPALVAGAALAVAVAPGVPGPVRAAAFGATVGSGVLGAYDDVRGNGDRRGLRGHLTAVRHGEVTTGAVKFLGIGAIGLLAGSMVRRGPRDTTLDRLLAGIVVAGSANAVNLLDLRPGRAIKAALLAASPGLLDLGSRDCAGTSPAAGSGLVLRAAALGAAAAALPDDLAERSMLGDAGANALGALLGTAAAASADRAGLAWRAAALTAVTLASEKVSFTKVIAGCPPLRALDGIGRRA
jgi:UDP-GlcNAc:undecaprenyl-phosphate/decaprenyl-phosphate GlcNAc-1-phosphate transferase